MKTEKAMGDAFKGMKVKERCDQLYKKSKAEVVEIFRRTSRLELSDAKKEPKDVLVSAILEYEFGRNYYADLETYRNSLKKALTATKKEEN